MVWWLFAFALLALGLVGIAVVGRRARRSGLDRWIFTYLLQTGKRRPPRFGQTVHLLLAICDHYEPDRGGVPADVAQSRVDTWVREYPKLFGAFRDSDGRPPRYTFFYPMEVYQPRHLDDLAGLCKAGFGEVEIHLHHDGDTDASLRAKLLSYKEILASRHGLLARRRDNGDLAYGFIHGNWALDNSQPGGRWCGVNNELDVLRETGCYADFTFPSAPDPSQPRTINSIYYAVDDPHRPKSHDTGIDLGSAAPPDKALLLIQGPLVLSWRRRRWGVLPRLENGCLQGSQPPSIERLDDWLRSSVRVPNRPDWYFVKLHTHGAFEPNQRVLLGEPMVRFHEALAQRAKTDPHFHFHYVTAREMYNLAKAAEAGWQGSVADARDFALVASCSDPSTAP